MNMDKLIHKYGGDVLRKHTMAGTLRKLSGIGPKTERKVTDCYDECQTTASTPTHSTTTMIHQPPKKNQRYW